MRTIGRSQPAFPEIKTRLFSDFLRHFTTLKFSEMQGQIQFPQAIALKGIPMGRRAERDLPDDDPESRVESTLREENVLTIPQLFRDIPL
jgi:hypothetical protein